VLSKQISGASFHAVDAHEKGYPVAFSAARKARNKLIKPQPHRAIASMKVKPYLLLQALVLPLLLVGLIYMGQPLIFNFWKACIEFWARYMAFTFDLTTAFSETGRMTLHVTNDPTSSQTPNFTTLVITTAITLFGFVASLHMNKTCLPLKFPLRIICSVQLATVLYFWLFPSDFLYRISDHSEELMDIGYFVMLATPVMLSIGYYILNQNLLKKVFNTLLILAFMSIMIPHQVLAQALIMTHFSNLFMPVLYLCFGAVFDALVFIALYSWVVSNTTIEATV
jgi:hypothetical protein